MAKEEPKESKIGGNGKNGTSDAVKAKANSIDSPKDTPAPLKPAAEKPKYPRETFADGRILKVKPEVIAGALHGSSKQEFTVDEVAKLVDVFKKKKVA